MSELVPMYTSFRPHVAERIRRAVKRLGRGWSQGRLLEECFRLSEGHILQAPHMLTISGLEPLHIQVTSGCRDRVRKLSASLGAEWTHGMVLEAAFLGWSGVVEKLEKLKP